MNKSQAVSVSMMIGLGVLMANGAMADAQNKKQASRRIHPNSANETVPDRTGPNRSA
jgi:hypothetical protein